MPWDKVFTMSVDSVVDAYEMDGENDRLVGRTDDWVIPLRLDTDRSGTFNSNITKQLSFLGSNTSSVVYNNKVYIFHGFINWNFDIDNFSPSTIGAYTNRAIMYDPSISGSVTFTQPLSDYRIKHIRPVPYVAYDSSACVHLDAIHILGGQSRMNGTLYSLHYKYNPTTDTYTQLASMPFARQGHSIVSVGNYIYVLGGNNSSGSIRNEVWRYDPNSNSWSTMTSMPRVRESFGVVEVNKRIFVFGGSSFSNTLEPLIDVYNTTSNTWSTLSSSKNLPTPRRHLQVKRVGNHALLVGGVLSDGTSTGVSEVFDLFNETWLTNLDDLSFKRSRFSLGIIGTNAYSTFGWEDQPLFGTNGGLWISDIMRISISSLVSSVATPTGFLLNNNIEGGLSTSWALTSNATHYTLNYEEVSSSTSVTLNNIQGNAYNLTNLTFGKEHLARVRACNSLGCSSYTSIVSLYVRPQTPTTISANNVTSSSATLRINSPLGAYDSVEFSYRVKNTSTWTTANLTSSTTLNITGLSGATTYEFRARTYISTPQLYSLNYSNTTEFTTITPIPLPPNNLTFDTPPRVDAGLNLKWNESTYATHYEVRIKLGSDGNYSTYTTTNLYYEFRNLNYGATYFIGVKAINLSGSSAYSSDVQATTSPKIPSLSGFITGNVATINISGMVGNYSFFRIWYRNVTDSGNFNYTEVYSIGDHNITNLLFEKTYEFKVSSFYTINNVDLESVDSFGNVGFSNIVTLSTGSARPQPDWEWSYTIAVGSNVYSVVNNNIFIMTANEWNEFTFKIKQFRDYKGLPEFTFTTVSSQTNFTTTILNQALNAIRDLSPHFTGGNTLPSNVVSGDLILKAEYFTRMRDCLNSIA
jgi:hypothetical protein